MQFEPLPFIDRWCNGKVSADLRSLYGVQFEPRSLRCESAYNVCHVWSPTEFIVSYWVGDNGK